MTDARPTQTQLELAADISRLRAAELIEELRTRISPGAVVDQVIGLAGGGFGGALAQRLSDQALRNPLACALIGTGLAWLALQPRTAREAAVERVEAAADELEEAVIEVEAARFAQSGGRAAHGGLAETLRAHPLVSAGIGLALGAAIGAFLPPKDKARRPGPAARRFADEL